MICLGTGVLMDEYNLIEFVEYNMGLRHYMETDPEAVSLLKVRLQNELSRIGPLKNWKKGSCGYCRADLNQQIRQLTHSTLYLKNVLAMELKEPNGNN